MSSRKTSYLQSSNGCTGHVNFPSKYKQYRAITGMEYKPPNSGTSGQSSSGKSKSGGSDLTWRTNEQNGGTARNGLQEIGLMSIKNDRL
jgi:hypothetical protein